MPTKSGIHLITHPFNLNQFNKEFEDFMHGKYF